MDGKVQSFGPNMEYSAVIYSDLQCRVVVDFDVGTVTLFMPYHKGGKVLVSLDEYTDFEGNMRDFVKHTQQTHQDRVERVLVKAREAGVNNPERFVHYPHDVGVLERRLAEGRPVE